MNNKNKLYSGWLIGSIISFALSVLCFALSFTQIGDSNLNITPEITEEVEKYGVNESTLPIVYVNTSDGDNISFEYETADVTIINNFTEGEVAYQGGANLKLRGNSTLDRPKKPYKLRLDVASDLFDMGSSKHWVLLANDIDHTFIRNKLVYDFYNDIGGSYATESLNVILMLNNEYQGVYQLCEQIRIDEERVDIFDWEGLAEDAAELITAERKATYSLSDEGAEEFEFGFSELLKSDFSWISKPYTITYEGTEFDISKYVDIPEKTGGFLLEMDFYHNELPEEMSLKTAFQQPFYFSRPSMVFTNTEIKEYADKYIQSFEFALHSDDFFFESDDVHYSGTGQRFSWNSIYWYGNYSIVNYEDKENDGKHYTEMFDLDSLVNNFWVCEFAMNWDSMKNSVFVSKDVGELAEISPVWDFDWAFGNNNMFGIETKIPGEWHTTNNYFTNEQYYQSEQWNRYLIKDPYFLLKAYEKYQDIRPTVIEDIIKTGGKLDEYRKLYQPDGMNNDKKWGMTYMQYRGENYLAATTSLKNFIKTRIGFIDTQCASFDTFVSSLGYYEKSTLLETSTATTNSDGSVTLTGKDNGVNASKFSFQVNGVNIYEADVAGGTASVTVPKDVLEKAGSNIVVIRALDGEGNYIYPEVDRNHKRYNPDHVEPLSNYKVF